MQIKKLNKIQTGPRLIKCPVCRKMTARITSVSNSVGHLHRKIICYSSNCGSERNV